MRLLLKLHLHIGLAILLNDLEGEVLQISLQLHIVHLSPDQTLDIKEGVGGIRCSLPLGCFPDHPLCVVEGHPGGRGEIALVIGDDDTALFLRHPHGDA
mmetsp:Transcript_75942/g.111183  ORF Transcript_75942/g.111183 Transcript_75942/m.111183 type:complete len:99 (-) Transcript_75942:75-371(-)